jgi:hypothetical protein
MVPGRDQLTDVINSPDVHGELGHMTKNFQSDAGCHGPVSSSNSLLRKPVFFDPVQCPGTGINLPFHRTG